MNNCPICAKSFVKLISLSIHYRKLHQKTAKDLYVALYCNNIEPTCKCGCQESVKFLDITRGFSEFVLGHAARVQNNFQTEKSIQNSLKTRRKMLKDGTWKPFALKETGTTWSAGLTKETDERLKAISNRIKQDKEVNKIYSDRMKELRENGIIVGLRGEKSGNWKGGISSLVSVCYANARLYREWKLPYLQQASFLCTQCGSSKSLHVHHNKERFSEILKKIADEHQWIFGISKYNSPDDERLLELKLKISDAVADYHINNKVEAIVLCEQCHKALHANLNF